jgi:hypothetical protein
MQSNQFGIGCNAASRSICQAGGAVCRQCGENYVGEEPDSVTIAHQLPLTRSPHHKRVRQSLVSIGFEGEKGALFEKRAKSIQSDMD